MESFSYTNQLNCWQLLLALLVLIEGWHFSSLPAVIHSQGAITDA